MANQEQQAMLLPIDRKMLLSIREAAEYSNIGINKIDELLKQPNCPFVLFVGTKKLVKRSGAHQSFQIGAHQKGQKLLKESWFYGILRHRGEPTFPAHRKGVH